MKQIITLAASLLICGTSFAQKGGKNDNDPAKVQRQLIASGRCALTGVFTDAHNRPIEGVKAFIYQKDSSIIASGFSDASGHYETNSVLKGDYTIKLVYPSAKAMVVSGMPLKPGFNQLNIKSDAPAADTTMQASSFMPKPAEKKKAASKH